MKNKKVVIVTGASSGIGLAACELFYQNGWRVIGLSKEKMKKNKFISRHCIVDLSDNASIASFSREIHRTETKINALVNNAAHQVCGSLFETTNEQWEKVFTVNVQAPFSLVKYFSKLLIRAKGSIVNVSSVHALVTSRDIAAYAASKGALLTLSRNMAIEFGPMQVRVNSVLPGAVNTPMLKGALKRVSVKGQNLSVQLKNLGKKHILGCVGKPEEIAQAIYFLSDNEKSSFITGQMLVVDGGALAQLSTE